MSAESGKLADTVADYLLANTGILKYFERFEHDEDLLEEKLEEFCSEVDAIIEEFIEDLEDMDDDGFDEDYE